MGRRNRSEPGAPGRSKIRRNRTTRTGVTDSDLLAREECLPEAAKGMASMDLGPTRLIRSDARLPRAVLILCAIALATFLVAVQTFPSTVKPAGGETFHRSQTNR